ncbi:MAG TPA: isopentenyl phosphate kinase [Candidatus Thermoplasmatota archaeon]|nr:isopentenyl phosphate kinase [Candidatus Thermoplasmatota archaeon]
MQLVKLGGSVLTDKAQYRTPRLDVLARLAHEIAASSERIVLVHGAGSYGHVLAKQHRVAEGLAPPHVVAQVHADVRELQALVLQALRDAGLAPISLSAYDLARLTAGELASFAYEPVHETLARRFLPVLAGDVLMDHARGIGIVSGDTLMVELARAVRPTRAIFVTDVDGIYDRAPHESGAKLLPRIELARSADVRASETRAPDVTGGMQGKLARAGEVAKAGAPVHIINGHAHGRLADTLAGKATIGTIVSGSPA